MTHDKRRVLYGKQYRTNHDPAEVRARIMSFILTYSADHGYAPSVREIGAAIGMKSTASTQFYIEQLVHRGQLERDPNKTRTLRVRF